MYRKAMIMSIDKIVFIAKTSLKSGRGNGLKNSKHIVDYNNHVLANWETYKQLPESEQVFWNSHDGSVVFSLSGCNDKRLKGLVFAISRRIILTT